jgi:hypothetical protein
MMDRDTLLVREPQPPSWRSPQAETAQMAANRIRSEIEVGCHKRQETDGGPFVNPAQQMPQCPVSPVTGQQPVDKAGYG